MKEQAIPIAMYDVEEKKLVAIFASYGVAGRHVYKTNPGDHSGKKIHAFVTSKSKMYTNRFNTTVCFRPAKQEYVDRLTDEKLILDNRYN